MSRTLLYDHSTYTKHRSTITSGPHRMDDGVKLMLIFVSAVILMVLSPLFMVSNKSRRTVEAANATSADDDALLEVRVKELEMAGDLDGATALLISAYKARGSSRAIMLAHELCQRSSSQSFGTGCPRSAAVTDGLDTAAAAPPSGPAAAAAISSTPVASEAIARDDVGTAGAGGAVQTETEEDGERRLPLAVPLSAVQHRRRARREMNSVAIGGSAAPAPAPAPSTLVNGACHGDVEAAPALAHEAPAAPTPAALSLATTAAATAATTTTTAAKTLPWERGWQGPEGFKPPPSSSGTPDTVGPPLASLGSAAASTHRIREVGDRGSAGQKMKVSAARNFTISQLNYFDGGVPTPVRRAGEMKARQARPIYIALRGEVYDASAGRELYGPGGVYSDFAGHDISRRVAHGVGKDASCGGGSSGSSSSTSTSSTSSSGGGSAGLDDLSLEGLDRFEEMTLRGWEDTFKARGYPRLGWVVAPPTPRLFSRAELREFDGRPAFSAADGDGVGAGEEGGGGRGEDGGRKGKEEKGSEQGGGGAGRGAGTVAGAEAAEGRAGHGDRKESAARPRQLQPHSSPAPAPVARPRPIYVGVRDKVFDVSFGGSEFYVEGGPYECLAGRDASRVLAKMSMEPEDVEGILDYGSLTDREEKNLADWVDKLGERGKGYPVVGWLDLGVQEQAGTRR